MRAHPSTGAIILSLALAALLLSGCTQSSFSAPPSHGRLNVTLPHNGEVVPLPLLSNTSWSETHNGGKAMFAALVQGGRQISYSFSDFASYGGYSGGSDLNYSDERLQYEVRTFEHIGGGSPSVERTDYYCIRGACGFSHTVEMRSSTSNFSAYCLANGTAYATYYGADNSTLRQESMSSCPTLKDLAEMR